MNTFRKTTWSIAACLLAVSPLPMAISQPKHAETPPNIVLVELFTSEGCSSCPPADELLRKVNGRQTAAGQLVVGISEHVTYWNRLGWTDPFSSSTYTDRQDRYANRFGLDSVYTPQMVVNGQQQFVGSNESLLGRALADQVKQKRINLRILSSEFQNGNIAIHFAASQLPSNRPLNIVATLTDDLAISKVIRGENGGRSLQHVAVARSLATIATIHGDTDTTVNVPWNAVDATKQGAAHHLILFAQEAGQGAIVGADATPVIL
ncbi:DUF1223 domain-containing protein [Terriglobus roseus]|uniref:Secreted protein n=1 Tax=Terriglobus roseus TaxID=392734 RepID=A0A1H4PX42_9BACT|nr:DUF1223 domain-containing protein [Terriglobus roseus]SEC12007.1 hypothetical protein SAMN05443244_2703 [Terriglobus roseus]